MVNHIHLDLVGGLSGDMFISSMLDAFLQFKKGLAQVIVDAGFPNLVELETLDHDDDQTPQSIAGALERLRALDGAVEVTRQAYWGKKQRQGFSMAVLCRPDVADTVTSQCFTVTTTLGVRREMINRATLPREEVFVHVGEKAYRVKVSRRSEGYTAKVEMDDLLAAGLNRQEQEQESVRVQAQRLAIEQVENH